RSGPCSRSAGSDCERRDDLGASAERRPRAPRWTAARRDAKNRPIMQRPLLATSVVITAALALGCPAKVPTPESQAQAGHSPAGVPVTDANDPRVIRDGDDLSAAEDAPRKPPPGPALGSGKPDTSNGVCKLYSPKLPQPECCPFETGFDAEKIKQLCGHALYM